MSVEIINFENKIRDITDELNHIQKLVEINMKGKRYKRCMDLLIEAIEINKELNLYKELIK